MRTGERRGCKYLEEGARREKKRRCIKKQEKRGEESVGRRGVRKKKGKSRRVDWRGKKSRQSLEYQALLWPREKEERRGGVAVKDGEHPENTKERINAQRLFKSFSH